MKKRFIDAITKLQHDMAIADLRLQNTDMSKSKITYNSVLYLDIITAHSGEYTASQIADILHISRPSVTQKINELEKMGCIVKKQSENDKRVFYLHINECCLPEQYTDMYDNIEKEIVKRFADNYSDEEIERFYHMIETIGTVCLEARK